MRKLTIYQLFFTESSCFQKGQVIVPHGVQVHSTGANNPWLHRYVQPDDGRLGPNIYGNSHNKGGGNVCASAYIGKMADGTVAVYQALPWEYCCWLSGSGPNGNANKMGYIGFEVCEDSRNNEAYFREAVMEASVLLTAHLCQKYNLPTDMVRDHKELHDMGIGSNHGDITLWLKLYGLTMDDYRNAVKNVLSEGLEVTYVDAMKVEETDVYYYAKAVNPGSYLNLRESASAASKSIAHIPRGEKVIVLEAGETEWWRVSYHGIAGYAMSKYLELVSVENLNKPEETPKENTVSVDRDRLEAIHAHLLADAEYIAEVLYGT